MAMIQKQFRKFRKMNFFWHYKFVNIYLFFLINSLFSLYLEIILKHLFFIQWSKIFGRVLSTPAGSAAIVVLLCLLRTAWCCEGDSKVRNMFVVVGVGHHTRWCPLFHIKEQTLGHVACISYHGCHLSPPPPFAWPGVTTSSCQGAGPVLLLSENVGQPPGSSPSRTTGLAQSVRLSPPPPSQAGALGSSLHLPSMWYCNWVPLPKTCPPPLPTCESTRFSSVVNSEFNQ